MGEITRDRILPEGKNPSIGSEQGVSESASIDLHREAEKAKITSAFITLIYHHFDPRSPIEDLDKQFLQSAQDLLGVDGAALLTVGDNGDGYRLRSCTGVLESDGNQIHPDDLPILGPMELYYCNTNTPSSAAAQHLSEITGTSYFLWVRHKEGSLALLLAKENEDRQHPAFTDNSGHVAYSSLLVYTDLLEKRSAHRNNFESELRFQTMMENIPSGIFRLNREGRLMRSNPALLNMLDFSTEDELESKHIWKHYCDPSEGRAIIEELLARGAVIDREVKLKKQDGTEFWASTTVRAVRDSNGRVTHFDGSIVDINPRKIMEDQLHESYFMATDALQSTVQAIMRITEIRDPYTAGHQERVAQLSRAIARELGVEENRAQGIYVAGILHDIGKIYVPSEILNKPGKITELEHNVLKTHVDVGYEILKPVKFPWPIAEAVYQHHERLDGSGYPRKLTEEQIILEARILGVADVVEAMSSHRPYRPALGVDLALSEIRRGSGKFFDPNVVEACLSLFEKGFEFRASS